MRFFESNCTMTTSDLNRLDLQSWWSSVRDRNAFSFFYTHQTKQLDGKIAGLSKVLSYLNKQDHGARRNVLEKLLMHVRNWKHMHDVTRRHSDRIEQVEILEKWLKTELGPSQEIKRTSYQPLTCSDRKLYNKWKVKSYGGLFSRRSTATKELDKAIHWFSTSVIFDRYDRLRELLDAIEVWKQERGNVSSRLPAVQSLEKYIIDELAKEPPAKKSVKNFTLR